MRISDWSSDVCSSDLLGLQLLVDLVLADIVDVEGRVRVRCGVARAGIGHGGNVEIGVPAPDSQFGGGSGNAGHADTGEGDSERAGPPHDIARHSLSPPFSFALPLSAT